MRRPSWRLDAVEPVAHNSEHQSQEQGRQEARREIFDLVKLAVVFLLVFWVVKTFVVEGYEVQGESMAPTLQDRDRILVFKLPHELSRVPLFRGMQPFRESDIIVFEGEDSKRFVKRVVAHNPAERGKTVDAQQLEDAPERLVKVEFERGVVRVNDWQIDESAYLPEEMRRVHGTDVRMLRPGEYYVLGDYRQISKDSRSFSAISNDQIIGRAVLRFWPLSKINLL